MLDVGALRRRVGGARIGRHIEHVASTSSTNDVVWRAVETGDADGLAVFAEHQTAGRGRLGRTWESPRGASLLCSVALIERGGGRRGGEIGMIAAVCGCRAVAACTELVPSIKWPNDLLVRGRKVGGVLVESRRLADDRTAYALGIGINCLQQPAHLPPALAGRATSLEIESRRAIERTALAAALLHELNHWLQPTADWTYATLRSAWLERAEVLGQRVRLRQGDRWYSGTVLDLDPAAALIVQLDEGGIRAFNAADTTTA